MLSTIVSNSHSGKRSTPRLWPFVGLMLALIFLILDIWKYMRAYSMRARRTLKTHTLETRTRVFFSNSKHSKKHLSQTQNMAKNTFLKLKTLQTHTLN